MDSSFQDLEAQSPLQDMHEFIETPPDTTIIGYSFYHDATLKDTSQSFSNELTEEFPPAYTESHDTASNATVYTFPNAVEWFWIFICIFLPIVFLLCFILFNIISAAQDPYGIEMHFCVGVAIAGLMAPLAWCLHFLMLKCGDMWLIWGGLMGFLVFGGMLNVAQGLWWGRCD